MTPILIGESHAHEPLTNSIVRPLKYQLTDASSDTITQMLVEALLHDVGTEANVTTPFYRHAHNFPENQYPLGNNISSLACTRVMAKSRGRNGQEAGLGCNHKCCFACRWP